MLLDTGSGCASPLSIDGVAFGVGTWSTSRFLTVQVGQTVLDRYRRSGESKMILTPSLAYVYESDPFPEAAVTESRLTDSMGIEDLEQ